MGALWFLPKRKKTTSSPLKIPALGTHLQVFNDGSDEASSISHPGGVAWVVACGPLHVVDGTPFRLNPVQGQHLDLLFQV